MNGRQLSRPTNTSNDQGRSRQISGVSTQTSRLKLKIKRMVQGKNGGRNVKGVSYHVERDDFGKWGIVATNELGQSNVIGVGDTQDEAWSVLYLSNPVL